jgi:hypothetical protein
MSLCVGGPHDLAYKRFIVSYYRLLLFRDRGWREDMGQ